MVTRTTQVTVLPKDAALYDELSTVITIEDEAGGEFLRVMQNTPDGGSIKIDPAEWPALRDAIDKMVEECKQ